MTDSAEWPAIPFEPWKATCAALIENTVRYLGVDVENALILAERTEI